MSHSNDIEHRRTSARNDGGGGGYIAIWVLLILALAVWLPTAYIIDYGILKVLF